MGKKKGRNKGRKDRKFWKNRSNHVNRKLVLKEEGQEYAQVLHMLGEGRCEGMCIDGTNRLCHIRGRLYKRVWISAGDIVLVGLRDFQDYKADIILKYTPDEVRRLKTRGELPENAGINDDVAGELHKEDWRVADYYIKFVDEDEDEDIDYI